MRTPKFIVAISEFHIVPQESINQLAVPDTSGHVDFMAQQPKGLQDSNGLQNSNYFCARPHLSLTLPHSPPPSSGAGWLQEGSQAEADWRKPGKAAQRRDDEIPPAPARANCRGVGADPRCHRGPSQHQCARQPLETEAEISGKFWWWVRLICLIESLDAFPKHGFTQGYGSIYRWDLIHSSTAWVFLPFVPYLAKMKATPHIYTAPISFFQSLPKKKRKGFFKNWHHTRCRVRR